MHLMDVVTTYLYGSLDNEIYMKIPEGFKMPKAYSSKPREMYSIRLQRSLYGLKQSGRMRYNRLSEYLSKEGYTNDEICPCVFIKKTTPEFVILAVYVDDINLIRMSIELQKAIDYLKKEFEMKDLGKTKLCLGLQIEHLTNVIFVHQSAYTEKVLKRLYMDGAHPLSTPMVFRSLDGNKDPFRPQEKNEELLGPEIPFLSTIGALMYLANTTKPDILVNLLARYSSAPTRRHWNGIKHIFRYLKGTTNMGLFYSKDCSSDLVGYADVGYLSDPHKTRSQTGYVLICGGTAISWRSKKQSIVATSLNHAEIITIHEASRECVWLRSIIHLIREKCGLKCDKVPTTLYEDNAAYIAQLKGGFIKIDRTKHISLKLFYIQELQKNGDIDVQQIRSSDNVADLFTKSLPTATFKKMVHKIGMQRLKDVLIRES
ncbi:secreted RxLR effector protein like [Capsicum annuum]